MSEEKKGYEEDVKFLNEFVTPDRKVEDTQYYTVGKIDSRKFYKKKGITKQTLQTVANANNDLINSSIKFSTDKLKDTDDKDVNRVYTSIYTDLGKIQARVSKRPREIRNPRTGEKSTKYSSISAVSIIKPLIDKTLVKECEEEIMKLTKL